MTTELKRVRDVIWLTPGLHNPDQCIGLVLYECEIGGFKGYVSVGKGESEFHDLCHIISWGGRIPDNVAARIWPDVEQWYDSS